MKHGSCNRSHLCVKRLDLLKDHLRENVRTHSFTLTASEKEAIDAVVAKRQGPKGDVWEIERNII
jgi:hypothetical protein